jgi:hypothetical protein
MKLRRVYLDDNPIAAFFSSFSSNDFVIISYSAEKPVPYFLREKCRCKSGHFINFVPKRQGGTGSPVRCHRALIGILTMVVCFGGWRWLEE